MCGRGRLKGGWERRRKEGGGKGMGGGVRVGGGTGKWTHGSESVEVVGMWTHGSEH